MCASPATDAAPAQSALVTGHPHHLSQHPAWNTMHDSEHLRFENAQHNARHKVRHPDVAALPWPQPVRCGFVHALFIRFADHVLIMPSFAILGRSEAG